MAINFPNSPSDNQTFVTNGRTYRYNSATGVWKIATSGAISDLSDLTDTTSLIPADVSDLTDTGGLLGSAGAAVYADMAALIAATGMSNGDFGLVTATNNIYVYNGSGWYKIATVQNDSPSAITGVDGIYTLADDGTPTVITAVSTDPEGFPLTWSYAVTSGTLGTTATVSQADNVFTITPSTTESDAGTFELTFSVTDGVNGAVSAISSFTLDFVVDWSLGTQQTKLTASDGVEGDFFGHSVSISSDGTTSIVGSCKDTFDTDGSAYIFTRTGTTWSQQQKLLPSDTESNSAFGFSVSISEDGNTAIIGRRNASYYSYVGAGAVYIVTRSGTTWSQQQKIQAPSPSAYDYFGHSVSISEDGNTAIIGAPYDDGGYTNAGAAYIFTRSGTTWSQQAKIQASDWQANDQFGWSVSISGDGNSAIIGAHTKSSGGQTYAGAAYIFTRSGTTWSEQQKIRSSDTILSGAGANSNFGVSVSISSDGNTVVAGAYGQGPTYRGAAYIFTRSGTTWSEQAKLTASDAENNDSFGISVSISGDGDIVIVGAYGEDTNGSAAGAAYVFTRSESTWSQSKKLQSSDVEEQDWFGRAVAISSNGKTAIAGSHRETINIQNGLAVGAAYVFVGG